MEKYVYKIENNINHKIYIGQTNNLERRIKEHRHDKRMNHPIYNAIHKYGWENFSVETLYFGEDYNTKEKEYIKLYRSNEKEFGWSYYMNMFKRMGITLSEQEEELFNHFKNPWLQDHYNEDFDFMMSHIHVVNDDQLLDGYDIIVFENGQGLLLDQNNTEYYPHLTPSNTGIKNPARIIKSVNWTDEINIEACYVTRTYMTRHGAGAFPTECNKEEINPDIKDLTNVPNPHQDTLRYGKLNVEELYERCQADIKTSGIPCRKTLAVTHMNEYCESNISLYEIHKIFKDNWKLKLFEREEN